jgi:hypothetical protein
VAFVGEDSFLTNLWALLAEGPVVAEIIFLPTLSTVSGDCRLLADESWRAVTHELTRLELFERGEERSSEPAHKDVRRGPQAEQECAA